MGLIVETSNSLYYGGNMGMIISVKARNSIGGDYVFLIINLRKYMVSDVGF